MSLLETSFELPVSIINPGQFFACCGLLELSHRLWHGAAGSFAADNSVFRIQVFGPGPCTLESIAGKLLDAGIDGDLSDEERNELSRLEARKRSLGKNGKKLSERDEERRSELGKRLREGAVRFGAPFNLHLDWWQKDGDDIPKTFAGKQEVLRMARAMLAEVSSASKDSRPLHYRSLLKAVKPGDGASGSKNGKTESKVEPFYFDASRFAHALDAGFSLDVQEKRIKATAAPLTELLALIGLQRFRPRLAGEWTFQYFPWHRPLGAVTAAVVASGTVSTEYSTRFSFRLRFRDDQKRYKAFGFAMPTEI